MYLFIRFFPAFLITEVARRWDNGGFCRCRLQRIASSNGKTLPPNEEIVA